MHRWPVICVSEHNQSTPVPNALLVILVLLWLDVACLKQLLRSVSQQALQITHKSVDIAFASCLVYDIFVVVIAESPAELFIVHLGFIFANAPAPGHLIRVGELELPAVTGPADEMLTGLVCEEFQQELPQLDWTTPC